MLKINTEKEGNTEYFTISGTDGKRQYYRLGHFNSRDMAQLYVKYLTGNKLERGGIHDFDMQDVQV